VVKQAQRLHEIGLWRRGDLTTTEADLEPERSGLRAVWDAHAGAPSSGDVVAQATRPT
jgi:hypothetical protein